MRDSNLLELIFWYLLVTYFINDLILNILSSNVMLSSALVEELRTVKSPC